MTVSRQIKDKLASTPAGVVLTIKDFDVEKQHQPALAKALSRLVLQGELRKIAKGKYYIPKETVFGTLKPMDAELVKDLLEQNGKTVGYITGTAAFSTMGLTTQISSSILIGTNKYRRPTSRGGVKVSFLQQDNAITPDNIPLLRLLDALRLIKEIPAATPDDCVAFVCNAVRGLDEQEQNALADLSSAYTPCVRALLGAIYESLGLNTDALCRSLNGVTSYRVPVSDKALPNKRNWNIV